jgi:poly(A) polymerase
VVAFTQDWAADAQRRDFTMNALYADRAGALFDASGHGVADALAGRIVFMGEPERRILEDHLRILRFFRFHARFGAGEPDREALDACTARANDLMALSRERIADELLKLLSLADPAPTVAIMLERAILKPVLPEIEASSLVPLNTLIDSERAAGIDAEALRRLAALLPPDPMVAEKVAVRLKLSNKARKRLACAAELDVGCNPRVLAYRVGIECAVDRLLLASDAAGAANVAGWRVPRLPIGGGMLIARGVAEGPAVARTLRRIEDRWVEAGFPRGAILEKIVAETLAASTG